MQRREFVGAIGAGAAATGATVAMTSVDGASALASNPGRDPPGALFEAGTAVRSIDPADPSLATHVGGFGTCEGCPTTRVREGDQLSARSFVVVDEDRTAAAAVAVVDVQGWFAGYKQGSYGITDLRREVTATLSKPREAGGIGVETSPGDVLVQATHGHATPSIVGIWGETNEEYLDYVYEQTRDAIVEAARTTEPALLEAATADVKFVNNVVLGQPNSNEGWLKDGQLPIVRARKGGYGTGKTGVGETLGTYAQVPLHENIAYGPGLSEMTTGYFGAAARWLEAELGGTAVVGPSTLGDQVSPMQGDPGRLPDGTPRSYQVTDRLGALVGNLATDALREDGRLLQDGTVAGTERHVIVPATNPIILGANCTPAGEASGLPIDRSCAPPYAYGGAIGTWASALRLGDVAIASEPGEAFPHVSFAVRDAFPEAETVMTAGQAQDQLGYYYAPWAFPTTFVYSADHHLFNVSQSLADQSIEAHGRNSRALGLGYAPQIADPTGNDLCRLAEAGVQVIVYPNALGTPAPDGDGITLPVGVYTEDARAGTEQAGTPVLDFDDGSAPVRWNGLYGTHTFPGPGTYDVTARLPDADESWTLTVEIEDAHHVTASAAAPTTTCATAEERTLRSTTP
jgi:hypothetical protein